mgnify:CR=1 FL=1
MGYPCRMGHSPEGSKTSQIQIRVSPAEKDRIRRAARAAGMGVRAWILARAAAGKPEEFRSLAGALGRSQRPGHVLAAISDLLTGLGPRDLEETVAVADVGGLDEVLANQLAAMVEHAASKAGCAPPGWTRVLRPLEMPWFASRLASLRMHLLASSPPAFRRRNLFVDSTVGDRV